MCTGDGLKRDTSMSPPPAEPNADKRKSQWGGLLAGNRGATATKAASAAPAPAKPRRTESAFWPSLPHT